VQNEEKFDFSIGTEIGKRDVVNFFYLWISFWNNLV